MTPGKVGARARSRARHFPYCGELSVAALPGGAKPFAGRVGWRGLPLRTIKGADTGFRRTNGIHPRLRVSDGLNFAVIALSKTVDVGRDHLIHRKRSPFPYEGKALTPLGVGRDCECRARHLQDVASEALPRRRVL